MLIKRDAQGLPIRLIVLAVIALIIIIVVVFIFSNESSKIVSKLESCGSKGGDCTSEQLCSNGKILYDIDCWDSSKVCCVSI